MKRILTRIAFVLVIGILVYNLWAESDRAREKRTGWVKLPEFKTEFERIDLGSDSGRGNLVGIQPYVTPTNFSTQFNYFVTLSFYFEQLKREKLLNEKTIVVLPEYIGSWLVAAREKSTVYSANTTNSAMRDMVLSNLYKFAGHWLLAPSGTDKSSHALFSMKARSMADMYQETFSELAKKYQVTIVGGSIVLPDPWLEKGRIETRSGALFNCSAVFGPDGLIIPPLVRKIYPVAAEKGFTSCGKAEDIPVYQTKAGKLGVLICADSWYPDAYANLEGKADLLAVPSLAGTEKEWQSPWKGYDGAAMPGDVDSSLVNHISEGEAWMRYSMGYRARKAGIRNGINVFFTGDCWDLKPEGRLIALQGDSVTLLPPALRKGRIVNCWIR